MYGTSDSNSGVTKYQKKEVADSPLLLGRFKAKLLHTMTNVTSATGAKWDYDSARMVLSPVTRECFKKSRIVTATKNRGLWPVNPIVMKTNFAEAVRCGKDPDGAAFRDALAAGGGSFAWLDQQVATNMKHWYKQRQEEGTDPQGKTHIKNDTNMAFRRLSSLNARARLDTTI